MKYILIAPLVLLALFLVFWFIYSIPATIIVNYQWEKSVNTYFELSDQASSLDKKLEYLNQYRQALVDKGLDTGDARYVFKTPTTQLENQMGILDTLIERLEEANKMDKSSLEYQQAIKQITTDEYQGFNSCLFASGYSRQSVWRWITVWALTCQDGKYAGETDSY